MSPSALGLLILLGNAAFAPAASTPSEAGIHVECRGRLRHGLVSIGAETTGTTITFDRITWELKFRDEASRTFAKAHHKESVTVIGALRQVAGTEIPVRWIVDVERISEWKESATGIAGTTVTARGRLRSADASWDMVLEADGSTWQLDLSEDATISGKARSLAGKLVEIKGRFERPAGSEDPRHSILRVGKLSVSSE